MKKLLIITLTITLLISCDNDPSPYIIKPSCNKSYIGAFIKCDSLKITHADGLVIDEENKLCYWLEDSSQENIVIGVNGQQPTCQKYPTNYFCQFPYIGSTDILMSNGDNPNDPYYLDIQAQYDKYIEEVGDTTYNKAGGRGVIVSCVSIKNISITANKEFDKNYPANTDLSSFFLILFDDIYATIKNNYIHVPESYTFCYLNHVPSIDNPESWRCLSKTNLEDYLFTEAFWLLFLNRKPEKTDTYTFHIKITFADGTVLENDAPPIVIKGKN
ncbi:hypothetical protein [Bacteroides sp. 519]|uniref:hypothetical protein n=1 Tax=Bacteroides sp. 519 TaxID=2302937 RepID=UPI0013D3E032|nr:hypothetical protein [Bacteroides sp. 519]NDV57999.1 hypothetical protein [Bacteroides sp. 519]